MIFHITGTGKSDNRCMETAAVIAAVSAIKYNRKTLILQMYSDKVGIEHVLDRGAAEVFEQTNRNDTGIDNLLLWATSGALSQTHFDVSVIDMFKEHNLFDVAPVSKKRDAAVELKAQKKHLSIVFEKAEKIYDTVIVVTKWYDKDLKEMVSELIKGHGRTILCMDQSLEYPVFVPKEDVKKKGHDQKNKKDEDVKQDDTLYFISDFDSMSSFATKVIKKHYGMQNLYTAPLCTEFSDARKKGVLLSFLVKNMDADVKSEAFEIIGSYKTLVSALYLENQETETELPLIEHFTPCQGITLDTLPLEGHFETKEEYITKGFWIFKKQIKVSETTFVKDTE